jgi:site-specific recombinase XerD
MEWQSVISRYLKHLQKQHRSSSTLIAYQKDIQQLASYFESRSLHNPKLISKTDLDSYIEFLNKQGVLSIKTISRKINSLKSFFKFLLSVKYITDNPGIAIKHPQILPMIPKTLTMNECRAIRDCARINRKLYTMIELLMQTGIRIGELSRIKRKDFYHNKERKYFLHINAFSTIPERAIELNPVIASCLLDYLKIVTPGNKIKKNGYLFFTKTGRMILIRNIRTSLDRIFNKAGVKNAKINDLRNTFIVFQLEHGLKIEKLAEVVGHRKTTTTQRYLDCITVTNVQSTNKVVAL